MQKVLNAKQVAAFYHDCFVQKQVEHFKLIALQSIKSGGVVVDIGGGCGYFANAASKELGISTRLIDMDQSSVDTAKKLGVYAVVGDAMNPVIYEDDEVVCFNLILHHLVGGSEEATLALQSRAIAAWKGVKAKIFVNEYIYESWFGNLSGWLIFQITKSKFLSSIGLMVSKALPSLKANTFGVGVRFRSSREWKIIFESLGYVVKDEVRGDKEFISIPRRLLLIKEIRRDSFLLVSQ